MQPFIKNYRFSISSKARPVVFAMSSRDIPLLFIKWTIEEVAFARPSAKPFIYSVAYASAKASAKTVILPLHNLFLLLLHNLLHKLSCKSVPFPYIQFY